MGAASLMGQCRWAQQRLICSCWRRPHPRHGRHRLRLRHLRRLQPRRQGHRLAKAASHAGGRRHRQPGAVLAAEGVASFLASPLQHLRQVRRRCAVPRYLFLNRLLNPVVQTHAVFKGHLRHLAMQLRSEPKVVFSRKGFLRLESPLFAKMGRSPDDPKSFAI